MTVQIITVKLSKRRQSEILQLTREYAHITITDDFQKIKSITQSRNIENMLLKITCMTCCVTPLCETSSQRY